MWMRESFCGKNQTYTCCFSMKSSHRRPGMVSLEWMMRKRWKRLIGHFPKA